MWVSTPDECVLLYYLCNTNGVCPLFSLVVGWQGGGCAVHLTMHENEVLRACSGTNGVFEWLHPNWLALGHLLSGVAWHGTSTWIKDDLDGIVKEFQSFGDIDPYVIGDLVGEIDAYLEDAACGLLEQAVPDSQWRKHRDVGRVYSQEGVAEIRLAEPYYIHGHRFRIRIYYAEPDVAFGGLVSLLLHAKNTDTNNVESTHQTWAESQDLKMAEAQVRGDDWVTRYENR